jgi:hypothetical protein
MLRSVVLGFSVVLASAGCGSSSAESSQPQLTSAVVSTCSAEVVQLSADQIAPTAKYEVIGVVDLTSAGSRDPLGLEERLRHHACAMNADAVGIMTTASGTGAEYVALKRRALPKRGAVVVPVRVEYFPLPSGSSTNAASKPAQR